METVIKESAAYRLRIKKNSCLRPEGLNNLEFVQEMLDEKGEISQTSTYQFFMTDAEIKLLCEKLVK
jgi:hypothetical protein